MSDDDTFPVSPHPSEMQEYGLQQYDLGFQAGVLKAVELLTAQSRSAIEQLASDVLAELSNLEPSQSLQWGMPIEELDPPVPVYNRLKRAGIHYVREVLFMSNAQLLQRADMNDHRLEQLDACLARLGYRRGSLVNRPELAATASSMRLDAPISDLGLSTRVYKALLRVGFRSVADVLVAYEMDFLDIRNFGRGMLAHLDERLQAYGHARRTDNPPFEYMGWEDVVRHNRRPSDK